MKERSWTRFGICSHGMYLGRLSIWWWDAWERRFILSFATAHRHLHFFPFFYEERLPCMVSDAIESAAEELAEEMRGGFVLDENSMHLEEMVEELKNEVWGIKGKGEEK